MTIVMLAGIVTISSFATVPNTFIDRLTEDLFTYKVPNNLYPKIQNLPISTYKV